MELGFLTSGANGSRTRDPHTASVMRYQLRHSPVLFSNGLQVTAQNWLPTNPLAATVFYLIWLGGHLAVTIFF